MIRKFRASNFGCVKDIELSLTPLHAFIGPNNSGKNTLLKAILALMRLGSERFEVGRSGWLPFDFRLGGPWAATTEFEADFDDWVSYAVSYIGPGHIGDLKEKVRISGELVGDAFRNPETRRMAAWGDGRADRQLGRAKRIRLRSEDLRLIGQSPAVNRPEFWDNWSGDVTGRGTLGVWAWFAPDVRAQATKDAVRVFGYGGRSGCPGELCSEGVLRYLAFRALPHLCPVSLLIVEEPERGLYPGVIPEVVNILRKVSEKTQVLIKTYSPLVVNELKPEEVSVVTRREGEGTKVAPIQESKNFEERRKIYRLGELWVSYLKEFE